MTQPQESSPDLFPPDEPPTFPQRTRSNQPIRPKFIRCMLEQHEAARKASAALDEAIKVTKKAAKDSSIPPSRG